MRLLGEYVAVLAVLALAALAGGATAGQTWEQDREDVIEVSRERGGIGDSGNESPYKPSEEGERETVIVIGEGLNEYGPIDPGDQPGRDLTLESATEIGNLWPPLP